MMNGFFRKALAASPGEWRSALRTYVARYAGPIQSVLQLGMARLIPIVVGIVSFPLLTKLLEPGEYGRLSLLVTVTTFVTVSAGSWLSSAIVRYYNAHPQEGEREALEAWSYYRGLPASIFIAVLAVIVVSFIYPIGILPYVAVCVVVSVQMLYAVYTTILQIKLKFKKALFAEALKGGVYVATLGLFIAFFDLGIVGALCAMAAASAVAVLIPIIGRPVPSKIRNRAYAKKFLIYGMPLMGSIICSWIVQLSDRWFLVANFDESIVGSYAANYSMVEFLVKNPGSVVLQLISILLFRRFDETQEGPALVQHSSFRLYVLAGSLLLAMVPVIFGQFLIGILASPAYRLEASVQIVLSIGQFFQMVAMFEGIALQIRHRTSMILIAGILAALVNLVANALLIPVYGPLGAAVATTIGYLVLALAVIGTRWLVVEKRRIAK